MIAIIAAIAVISVIATIAVIAIIGTSVDAENVVLCTESAEGKCRENNIQLSSCTEWAGAGGWGRGLGANKPCYSRNSFRHPSAAPCGRGGGRGWGAAANNFIVH